MELVALAALGLVALTVASCSALIARQARQHARERMLLVNQLLHLSGRPWQEAPAQTARREDVFDEAPSLLFPPDQLPD